MRFQVYGIKRETGEAIKPLVIVAPDEEAAMTRARKAGVAVVRIKALPDDLPANPGCAVPPPVRSGSGLRLATTLAIVCITCGLLAHLVASARDIARFNRDGIRLEDGFWLGYSLYKVGHFLPWGGVLIFLTVLRAKQ